MSGEEYAQLFAALVAEFPRHLPLLAEHLKRTVAVEFSKVPIFFCFIKSHPSL
jgi:hypothetical protein